MARPRVFISSTFYDLRQVREDIERGIRELGYEPVRHETGAIPYSRDGRPETAAYREERKSQDEAIKTILLTNHPIFKRFAELTKTPYRVFFTNRKELSAWITDRGWEPARRDNYDPDSVAEWGNASAGGYLKLTHHIFDQEGRLNVAFDEWKDEWLQFVRPQNAPPEEPFDDLPPPPAGRSAEDIPF